MGFQERTLPRLLGAQLLGIVQPRGQGRSHGGRPPRARGAVRLISGVDDGRARAGVHSFDSPLGASGSNVRRVIRLDGAVPGQAMDFAQELGAVSTGANSLQLRVIHVWMART